MNLRDNQLLLKVSNIAIGAGIKIMQYYSSDIEVEKKEDNSPITKADLAANDLIINGLRKIDNNIPILSEENLVEWNERKNWSKYWLVDPLDGTKEFINKNDEFTVNIALINKHIPILGIIYAPALSKLYFAKQKHGAFKINTSSKIKKLDNLTPINVSDNKNNKIFIIGSRSHSNENFNSWIKKNFNDYSLITKGSSLKFCTLAEGKADIYPRFSLSSEWDIAAGHIILEEAGGKLKDINGKKILYNIKESPLNPNFVASNNKILF